MECTDENIEVIIREIEDSTENIAHIGNLDARESDDRSDTDLHEETKDRRYSNP